MKYKIGDKFKFCLNDENKRIGFSVTLTKDKIGSTGIVGIDPKIDREGMIIDHYPKRWFRRKEFWVAVDLKSYKVIKLME